MSTLAPPARLDHFIRVSRLLAGQLDFRSAIRSVATEVAKVVPYDHLDVCIVGHDGLAHSAYETPFETAWGTSPSAPVAFSPIRSLLTGEVSFLLSPDAPADPRFNFPGCFNRPIHENALRSRAHVPMRVHGEIIGALSCSLREPGRYGEEDVKNLGYIADLLSPYFYAIRAAEQAKKAAITEAEARAREEGLRLGALRLTEALEAERQRIGMDLHDQTLADLTRLARRLDRLAGGREATPEALEHLSEGLHRCMQDLRRIIENARPAVLELFGFAEAVESHLDRSVRETGAAILWTIADETGGAADRLDPGVRTTLFRVVQEAVNNAVRHSGARHVEVRISLSGSDLAVRIADDGTGLPRHRARRGSGIDSMRTRARLVSARLRIAAGRAGTGTEVTVELPAASAAASAAAEPVRAAG